MNGIMNGQAIPQTWMEAAILLIPKEGLDGTDTKKLQTNIAP